jgi:diguanylate cyclase (GGDEF)-like protein
MSPDELTGLPDRGEILARLESSLSLASQHHQPLAILYIDTDRLLSVNSTYGHLAGDAYIHHVAGVLSELLPPHAAAGRVAGDEFLLVATGASAAEALALAETVRSEVEARPLSLTHQAQTVHLTVSVTIGVADYPADGVSLTAEELIRRAYDALLRGKETGGNTVVLYSAQEERDALTRILKREALLARFARTQEEADRTRSPIAIINLDIDEFESINRQYGRYTGDEVLRRVGRALANNFREMGFVGRYAGDEFVVVLPDSRAETAFVLAEEVRRAIEDTPIEVQVGEQKFRLTLHVSGGVAEYPSDGNDWESLFRRSNEALFRAKRLGRNRICLPVSSQMVTKTSHYTQTQLEKLADLAKKTGRTEAHLLREALDDLLRKYEG